MKPIKKSDLESLIEGLNKITDSPAETYSKDSQGKFVANVGNYHLSGAYGGWKLERIVNTSGGVQDVLSCGYTTKRDLYYLIHAYLRGMGF